MSGPQIMFVCDYCSEHNPEMCGHYDAEDIRLAPNGSWLCESCFDEETPSELGRFSDAPIAYLEAAPSPSPAPGVVEALRGLLARDERNTCQHEETHRGGFLWEICDQCGAKWADDQGGKPEWKDPPEWIAAREALTSLAQGGDGGANAGLAGAAKLASESVASTVDVHIPVTPANPAQVTELAEAIGDVVAAVISVEYATPVSIRMEKEELEKAKDRLNGLFYRTAAIGAGGQAVASVVPEGCTGSALAFDPGVLHVNKDGSGYIAVDEDAWQLEDDRCEGVDGPEGSVHWITRLDASEMQALRDFLNGAPRPHPAPSGQAVATVDDVAARLWKADAENSGTPASVAAGRTREAFDDQAEELKARWRKFAKAALSAIAHPVQPGWRDECTTEGCGKPASVHFVRGGIGSYYCHDCYLKVQALPAAPQPKGE